MHETRYFDNKEICESDMNWQEEMRTIMTNQSRSSGAKSFKKKRIKRKMAKRSRRKNRLNTLNVLVACEESQRVCLAFLKLGHNAFSCDIQEPSGNRPDRHIKGDVLPLLERGREFTTMDGITHTVDKWDLIVAHPPCTYLSNAGACRLYPHKGQLNQERYKLGLEAKEFFMKFYNADCEHIAVENPIPSKVFDMPPYAQIIQPYEYGHPFSKKTCLWLKGLPKLKPTNVLTEYKPYVSCGTSHNKGNKDKAGVSRAGGAAKVRSKTFEGIAKAMAEQWSKYIGEGI